jgi:hypothetical protein
MTDGGREEWREVEGADVCRYEGDRRGCLLVALKSLGQQQGGRPRCRFLPNECLRSQVRLPTLPAAPRGLPKEKA